MLWHHTIYAIGTPAGGHTRQMLEWVGYFYGLGAAIIGLAAFAMGRYFSRPRIVEEPVVAAESAPVAEARAADAPVADRPVADAPVAESADYAPAAEAPAEGRPGCGSRSPRPAADAPATTSYRPATTTYRRRPGLLRRFRGS